MLLNPIEQFLLPSKAFRLHTCLIWRFRWFWVCVLFGVFFFCCCCFCFPPEVILAMCFCHPDINTVRYVFSQAGVCH